MDLLPKVPEKLWAQLVRFPVNFSNLLFAPRVFFASLRQQSETRGNDLTVAAFSFAFICLGVGAAVGGYLNLSGGPQLFDIQAIIFVLFVWCITGVLLHPFLRLFRGRGTALQTITVVLFVSAALHILWIPALAVISKIVTETRVVLTYDYAVSYSLAGRSEFGGSGAEILDGAEGLAGILQPRFSESYVLEREPEKEGTILPPIGDESDAVVGAEGLRVALEDSGLPPPDRREEAVLGSTGSPLLIGVLALYLLSHVVYLGIGFAEVHGRTPAYWISLAFAVPLAMLGLAILVLAALILA